MALVIRQSPGFGSCAVPSLRDRACGAKGAEVASRASLEGSWWLQDQQPYLHQPERSKQ